MTREEAKNLKQGDVVYFVERNYGCKPEFYPMFGVLSGPVCSDDVYITLLSKKESRWIVSQYVESHIDDFKTEEEWHPLPKGWSYNTKLFDIEIRESEEDRKRLMDLSPARPEDIRAALDEGLLVYSNTKYHGEVNTEIDRHKGWRIVKAYPAWTVNYGRKDPCYRTAPVADVFLDHESVKARIEEIIAARKAEAALTDEEWSIRQIEKFLKRLPNDEADRCRQFLMEQPNIDDIEVRTRDGVLYWRYFSKKEQFHPVFE